MKSLFNTDTSIQAILYIVNRIEGKKDFHKIFKILYFADQMHLSKYAKALPAMSILLCPMVLFRPK